MWWIDLEPIHPDVFTVAVRFMPILIGSIAQTTSILKSDWLTNPILINIMRPRLLTVIICHVGAMPRAGLWRMFVCCVGL
jgi:hypothetical protein